MIHSPQEGFRKALQSKAHQMSFAAIFLPHKNGFEHFQKEISY
jgi:hypothetical protein